MKTKKISAIFICLIMIPLFLPATASAAGGDLGGNLNFSNTENVSYANNVYTISAAGTYSVSNKSGTAEPADCSIYISASTGQVNLRLNGVNIKSYGTSYGAIHCNQGCTTKIILADGTVNTLKSVNAYPALFNHTYPLIIEGEALGTGRLNAYGNNTNKDNCTAGIGATKDSNNITINGGVIYAEGYFSCVGIGGFDTCKNLTINGGIVTAKGGLAPNGASYGTGAGIGALSVDNITINGGSVTATGSESGAGIGGSCNSTSVKNIRITGGNVVAKGGSYKNNSGNSYGGAGIGGGYRLYYDGGSQGNVDGVTISGGTVEAIGGFNAAGIGGGTRGNCSNVTISGGIVNALGGGDDADRTDPGAAGIGGGLSTYDYGSDASGNCENITISGGEVTASGYHGIGTGKTENQHSTTTATSIKIAPGTNIKTFTAETGPNLNNTGAAPMTGSPFTQETDITSAVQLKDTVRQQYFHSLATNHLIFIDSSSYDIPSGKVKTAITPVDISGGARGGVKPYSFSFSGTHPDWLEISSDGIITGTRPDSKQSAVNLTVMVVDSGDSEENAAFTINVGAVTKAGAAEIDPADSGNNPYTGDEPIKSLWIFIMAIALSGFAGIMVLRRRG